MAITITNQPEGNPLNAYNNSVIEFTATDNPVRAIVEVSGITAEISAINNKFYYNLKEIVSILINQNQFRDTKAPEVATTYTITDETLFLNITLNIDVIKQNGSREDTSIDYLYLKSVEQDVRPIYNEVDAIRLLIPSNELERKVSYFEGYPFDVSIFTDSNVTGTLSNQRTGGSLQIPLSDYVTRLFISNGENDGLGFENNLPLLLGENRLTVNDGADEVSIVIDKKPVKCGKYLKWFNQSGGWSYWLFDEIYRETLSHRTSLTLNTDTQNLEDTSSRILVAGKEGQKDFILDTYWMNDDERLQMEQIFTSPKVYLYAQRELQPFKLTDWKEVNVKSGSATVKNSKMEKSRFSITIELAPQNLQTYAS